MDYEALGTSISALDADDDGYDDLLVGAPGADSSGGTSQVGLTYLFQGNSSPSFDDYALLYGDDSGEQSGVLLHGVHDYDDDGYDDILVCTEDSAGSPLENHAYLMLGGL